MTAPSPLTLVETVVHPEWVDYNGHMQDAAYAFVFSQGTDALMKWIGIDERFRGKHRYTMYTLESHIRYLQEAYEAQALAVKATLMDHDVKRLHLLMHLVDPATDAQLAQAEFMLMGIQQDVRRPAPFPEPIRERVELLRERHGHAHWPPEAGGAIGIRRTKRHASRQP